MSQNSGTSKSTSDQQLTKKRVLIVKKDDINTSKYMKFNKIDDIFNHYTSLSEFCIGGKIELNKKASKFFYESSNGIQCLDVLNISEKEMDTLANNCSVSPFGMGSKSVIDPSVRQAKELSAMDFSFQFNLQMKSNISFQIKKLLGGREFLIEPYKLNIYPEGGHFKRHKDTLKNEKMIASLVICLPIPFEGDILTVENKKGKCVNFDWGKEISPSTAESNNIYWACFFCSCDHFISRVTKGNRITLAYDIFTDDSKQNISDDVKATQEKYQDECSENLRNFVKNLDVKEIHGYFPNHVYRFSDTVKDSDTDEERNGLRDKLKGNDLILYDVFDQLGWKVDLEVYYPDIESYGPYIEFSAECEDRDFGMEDAIGEDDREKLNYISTLKLLNKESNCKTEQIHEYEGAGDEYTGNAPNYERRFFYAGTIMVLRHQTKSKTRKENVKKNRSS